MSITVMEQALEALQEAFYKAGWIGMSPEGADEIQREVDEYVTHRLEPAITSLRTAIEAAESVEPLGYWNAVQGWVELPEEAHNPVAWVYPEALEAFRQGKPWAAYGTDGNGPTSDGIERIPLYTTPTAAQRTWVGLTDKDFSAINQSCLTKLQAATSAESILKEKNT
jgi:hypothetical protein